MEGTVPSFLKEYKHEHKENQQLVPGQDKLHWCGQKSHNWSPTSLNTENLGTGRGLSQTLYPSTESVSITTHAARVTQYKN